MKVAIASCAVALTLVGATIPGAAVAGTRAGPTCSTAWGVGGKHAGSMVSSRVSRVTAGEHPCFDRLVIGIGTGKRPGYRVRYVSKIIQDGSGKPVPVRGPGKLLITVMAPAARHFPSSGRHLVNVAGFRTLRQVAGAGSFEGLTSLGLGVRAKLPFRVFVLAGPGKGWRLVVDVADQR